MSPKLHSLHHFLFLYLLHHVVAEFSVNIVSPRRHTQTQSNFTIVLEIETNRPDLLNDYGTLKDWLHTTSDATPPPAAPHPHLNLHVCLSIASIHFAADTPVLSLGCVPMFDLKTPEVRLNGALSELHVSSVPYGEHDLLVHVHTDNGQGEPGKQQVPSSSVRFLSTPIIAGKTAMGAAYSPRQDNDHLTCQQGQQKIAPTARSISSMFARAYLPLQQQRQSGTITVGVLVHRGSTSFANSVQSWYDRKIYRYVKEIIVYLQEWPFDDGNPRELLEVSTKDPRLAAFMHATTRTRHHDSPRIVVIGAPTQLNIAPAFARLVETSTSELFMFLEEDFVLDTAAVSNADVATRLEEATHVLMLANVDVVRLRSRTLPGVPNCADHWQGREQDLVHLRTGDIARHSVLSASFRHVYDVAMVWKCRNMHCAWSTHAGWTNNPFVAKTQWLLETIVPIAVQDWTRRVESAVNLSPLLWDEGCYVIAAGEGLFTHRDEDRPLNLQSPCAKPRVEEQ